MFFLLLVGSVARGQVYRSYSLKKDELTIKLSEGTLHVVPISDKAMRIRWQKSLPAEEREFVLTEKTPLPVFRFSEAAAELKLSTSYVTAVFNKKSCTLTFRDAAGRVFLSEKPGRRKLLPDSVAGQPCYVAEQSFESPEDEYLFGLGQFQDGQYNLRNVSRKLIQVNTQIAIPFLYSSKGYGLLWHQYGLTYFNPADNPVSLGREASGTQDGGEVEVTTTSGTQKVSRQQALYTGTMRVEKEGDYSLFLDLGNMDNRHFVAIDGIACIDQSNLWLPPAAGCRVHLKAGEHSVKVICRSDNTPRLTWKPVGNETVFRSPHSKSLDYIVFYGKNADEVIGGYRKLSGQVPLLPLWAYGFWQCRERYASGAQLVETVSEFRKRRLPVDVIVQDWQYWGKYGWGVPKFDEAHYPDPDVFIRQLHDLDARLSVSVWENPDQKSDVIKDYVSKNLFIPGSPWIDIYNPEAQKTHWNALNKNLFIHGVDSWWMDATEPENDALAGKRTYFGPGEFYRLTYPLFVSKAVYEGQRRTDPDKRVAILTRSAFAGQQRYGTINWSGDIGGNWDSFKRQIAAGLNYNLTGMPYWTTDIGGFFRPGKSQYTDPDYQDLLLRWFQWGIFNPIFRVHGYQSETEPWKYGEKVEAGMRAMLNLRYRLIPYIYSEAWKVTDKGSTMMRPLVMDFAADTEALKRPYEYMFGKSFLVAPVTGPHVTESDVYLPAGAGWYEFATGRFFEGGRTVKTQAAQDQIPLFVRAGSVIPMGPEIQSTADAGKGPLEIRIYRGKDASFNLYEDEGDGYNYEKGKYSVIRFSWNEKKQALTIAERTGSFPGMISKLDFNIVLCGVPDSGSSPEGTKYGRKIHYSGGRTVVNLNHP